MSGHRRVARTGVAGFAAALMLLGACSDDSEEAPADDTASADAEAGEQARPDPEPIGEPLDLDREPIPADGGGEATGPLADADLEITTDEGDISVGGSATIPEAVSDDFPIPDDFTVLIATDSGTDAGFTGTSTSTVEELADFYETNLVAAGYEITERPGATSPPVVLEFTRGAEVGQVAISTAPGGTGSTVLVTIGDGTTADSVGG